MTDPPARPRWGEGFVRPVRYHRRARYRRPPKAYLRLQWLGPVLTALGVSPRYVVTLAVPGRRTGTLRRTALVLARHEGAGHLVALAGESEWVRNVRANAGRARLGRRRLAPVTLVELPVEARAPVIRAYLDRAGRQADSRTMAGEAREYFGIEPGATIAEIARVAAYYPVFRVVPDRP